MCPFSYIYFISPFLIDVELTTYKSPLQDWVNHITRLNPTTASPPSRIMDLIPLVGKSGEHRKQQWANDEDF